MTQSELAKWFDVERKTIYNWLTRLEDYELDVAIRDNRRPGRPRKLTSAQRDQLGELLENPPASAGYDAPAWTTSLVRQVIRERFDVDYSRPTCRRLMREAGMQYKLEENAALVADSEESEGDEQQPETSNHYWTPR